MRWLVSSPVAMLGNMEKQISGHCQKLQHCKTLIGFFYFSERYCIQNIPPVIVSSGHELYIYFRARSDAKETSQLDKKFQGSYLTHSRGEKQLTNDHQ